ncbi:MAG: hypothetical protein KDB18_08105, partial [Salinibacterium sp.]|nr:hypothetical protein [Salinibacterium sp.]
MKLSIIRAFIVNCSLAIFASLSLAQSEQPDVIGSNGSEVPDLVASGGTTDLGTKLGYRVVSIDRLVDAGTIEVPDGLREGEMPERVRGRVFVPTNLNVSTRPIVFLHGWGAAPFVYAGLLEAWLEAGIPVVAGDYSATFSTQSPLNQALEFYVLLQELRRIQSTDGPQSSALINVDLDSDRGLRVAGHSMGAVAGIILTSAIPVERLLLYSPYHGDELSALDACPVAPLGLLRDWIHAVEPAQSYRGLVTIVAGCDDEVATAQAVGI